MAPTVWELRKKVSWWLNYSIMSAAVITHAELGACCGVGDAEEFSKERERETVHVSKAEGLDAVRAAVGAVPRSPWLTGVANPGLLLYGLLGLLEELFHGKLSSAESRKRLQVTNHPLRMTDSQ